jgi:hypothetical protein
VNGIVEKSHDALIHDEKVKGLLLKELQGTGRKAGLAGFEIIEGVVLTDSEWTPQNVSSSFIFLGSEVLRFGGERKMLMRCRDYSPQRRS